MFSRPEARRSNDSRTESTVQAGAASTWVGVSPSAVFQLLGQHYGDGTIYLQDSSDRVTLAQAVRDGFVSSDGFLTASGHRMWLRSALT